MNPWPPGASGGERAESMKTNSLFFIEFLFFDVVALAWAAWEYWRIRPGKTDKTRQGGPEAQPSPEDPGHPEG